MGSALNSESRSPAHAHLAATKNAKTATDVDT
jgi:hypothetical protein